jgi:hypothetical protein
VGVPVMTMILAVIWLTVLAVFVYYRIKEQRP